MKYCPTSRGHFTDVTHMNTEMVNMWNERVAPDDLVYILGDIAFGSAAEAIKLVRRMNGHWILIEGNHDYKNLRDPSFRGRFREVHKYLEIVHDKQRVVLFHYPIFEWNGCHRGSVHFYGHSHGKPSLLNDWRAIDVGYDSTGEIVVELSEMIRRALTKGLRGHHEDL
jgi:calcineurin-like phosphoesterase family protein